MESTLYIRAWRVCIHQDCVRGGGGGGGGGGGRGGGGEYLLRLFPLVYEIHNSHRAAFCY